MLAHQTTRRVVEDVLGASTPIASITRDQCRDLLETLRWLPVNMAQKFGDVRVRDAAKAAKADLSIRTINTTNLNAYMARFATMMNWAVTEELIGRNPARGLQIAETVHPHDRRKPFELWQLQRIFNAPIYTGCKDEQNGYSVVGTHIAVGARFWVPLICLFSGMRLNEACQLDVTDVREIEGVLCFVITEQSLVGTRDKSLKTRSSERIVPAQASQGRGRHRPSDQGQDGAGRMIDDDGQSLTDMAAVRFPLPTQTTQKRQKAVTQMGNPTETPRNLPLPAPVSP